MKKAIIIIICMVIGIYILMMIMVSNNDSYINSIENDIINNTNIKEIDYINKYDNNYIVMDKDYVYVVSSEYKIIKKEEIKLIHENTFSYDIVYEDDELMYFFDKYEDSKLIYEYYDIYSYELINQVQLGDSNG